MELKTIMILSKNKNVMISSKTKNQKHIRPIQTKLRLQFKEKIVTDRAETFQNNGKGKWQEIGLTM